MSSLSLTPTNASAKQCFQEEFSTPQRAAFMHARSTPGETPNDRFHEHDRGRI
jgi:hypothetical protein